MGKDCFHIFTEDSLQGDLLYPMLAILAVALLFIVLTNTFMIVGMIRINRRLSISKKLFILLSVSDLVTGITTVPIQAAVAVLSSEASCELVATQAFFNMLTPGSSMFLLLTISILRYLSLKLNSKLRARICKQNVIMFIVGIEISAAVAFALWYSLHISQTNDKYAHGSFLIFVSCICIAIIGTTVIINVLLLTNLSEHNQSVAKSVSKAKSEKFQRRITKTILIILVMLIFCYLPVIVSFSVASVFVLTEDPRLKYYHHLIPWSFVPLILNSGFNSFIYILRNKKLKRCIWKLMSPGSHPPIEMNSIVSNHSQNQPAVNPQIGQNTDAMKMINMDNKINSGKLEDVNGEIVKTQKTDYMKNRKDTCKLESASRQPVVTQQTENTENKNNIYKLQAQNGCVNNPNHDVSATIKNNNNNKTGNLEKISENQLSPINI